jgi:hypothetical protein
MIYVSEIIQKWRLPRHGNISISINFNNDTMLFADNQILLAKYKYDPQSSVYNFSTTAAEFSMEIMTKLKLQLLEEWN